MGDNLFVRAKNVDLFLYMQSLGYKPVRSNKRIAYFNSPFREEKHPSFAVDRVNNWWNDYGEDSFGSIIDLVMRLTECSETEAAEKIVGREELPQFHKPPRRNHDERNIEVVREFDVIESKFLVDYVEEIRKIPIEVANKYCQEVWFQFGASKQTTHYGIGIKNDKGGWAIRSIWFKGTTRPSGISTMKADHSSLTINLFEGLFDFLSFAVLTDQTLPTCIVLNSLVFIPMMTEFLHGYDEINLYLDNDGAADDKIEYMFANGLKPTDRRDWYKDYNDLNDYYVDNYDI